MKVIRARTAGFCMGVSLALRMLDRALHEKRSPSERIVTIGEIIHNPQVMAEYESKGVVCLHSIHEVRPGDTVVIRAHGIPKADESWLRSSGAKVHDATCPRVKQAQMAIAKATQEGETLLLFGEEQHPEVIGLISYAGGPYYIFDSLEAFAKLPLEKTNTYVLAAQTTQDQAVFQELAKKLYQVFPKAPVLSTICDATGKRQSEALHIASQVEAMVVVGGQSSGNTRRLAALAAAMGVPTWHVEQPQELPLDKLTNKSIIGLTAGASTPKKLIDATQHLLEEVIAPASAQDGL